MFWGWQEGVGWVEGADGEGGEGASLPKLSISQGVWEAGMARGEKGGEGIWGGNELKLCSRVRSMLYYAY